MIGYRLPENFAFPYLAGSVREFWQRWHMSLTRWFRDYLYIPLGGSRGSKFVTARNLAIVFLLCGLWHGAAWTFIAWGAVHGAVLVLERGALGAVAAGAALAAADCRGTRALFRKGISGGTGCA